MDKTGEQFTASAKENLVMLQTLTTKAHADAERLVELNLATSKHLMAESFEYAKAMMAAKDPQSLATLQAGLAKPMGDIATTYTQEFQKIMAGASTEFTKAAQASMVDVQKGFSSMLGSATKNTPSGTGTAFEFFNQAMAASQKAFQTAQASAQQAIDTVKKASKTT
jgi:phasin family protein